MDECIYHCVFTEHNPELTVIWSKDYGLAPQIRRFCCRESKDAWICLATRLKLKWANRPEKKKDIQPVSEADMKDIVG